MNNQENNIWYRSQLALAVYMLAFIFCASFIAYFGFLRPARIQAPSHSIETIEHTPKTFRPNPKKTKNSTPTKADTSKPAGQSSTINKDDNTIYNWNFQGRPQTLSLNVIPDNPESEPIINELANKLIDLGKKQNFSDDQIALLAITFTQQALSYDYEYAKKDIIYLRYITTILKNKTGVCSEKSALLTKLLNKLGYGSAFVDMPSINHQGVGIVCKPGKGINGSDIAYVETTANIKVGDDIINPLTKKVSTFVPGKANYLGYQISDRKNGSKIFQSL